LKYHFKFVLESRLRTTNELVEDLLIEPSAGQLVPEEINWPKSRQLNREVTAVTLD